MGPRSRDRGYPLYAVSTMPPASALQWVHGHVTAVIAGAWIPLFLWELTPLLREVYHQTQACLLVHVGASLLLLRFLDLPTRERHSAVERTISPGCQRTKGRITIRDGIHHLAT